MLIHMENIAALSYSGELVWGSGCIVAQLTSRCKHLTSESRNLEMEVEYFFDKEFYT